MEKSVGYGREREVCLCRLFLLLLHLYYIVTILINKTVGIIEKINMGYKKIFFIKNKSLLYFVTK
jgi:hypothetical protein